MNSKPELSSMARTADKVLKVMSLLFLLLFLAFSAMRAHGQTPNVVISQQPPETPQTVKMFYNGSNQIEYVCKANGWKTQAQWSTSAGTLIQIQVTSGTATVTTSSSHGVIVGTELVISGSNTSGVNGSYVVTSVGTLTMTLNKSMPDGTYSDNSLRVTVTQPKTSAAVWTIQKFLYSGSNLVDIKSSKSGQICDNRAATGTLQIAYQ